MKHEALTHEDLMEVIHRQGFESLGQVRSCELEPNGTFYLEALDPSPTERQHTELLAKIDALAREVAALSAQSSQGS
jgi:uncharacterized membrane protein YcaP (DUF421 family)